MRRGVRWIIVGLAMMIAAEASRSARADDASRVLDGFEEPSSWNIVTSDGVQLRVVQEAGQTGRCARLDYDFTRGSGYAIIRKELAFDLPPNYRFSYLIRGEGPSNTVEFKLIDESGDNVWWANQRDFHFPKEWSRVVLPMRKVVFAWGPSGGAPLHRVRWVEFAITSFNGGRGSVWLDELRIEPMPKVSANEGTPTIAVSSRAGGEPLAPTLGPNGRLDWSSRADDPSPILTIDLDAPREIGGIIIGWGCPWAKDFDVLTSIDGDKFETAARVRGCSGGRSYIALPDTTVRKLRVAALSTGGGRGVTLESLRVMPSEFGDSQNAQLAAAAMDAPRGRYPRYLRGEASYWTVVGTDGEDAKPLMGEDGSVEVAREGFSLEPFVFAQGKLTTWGESVISQSLEEGSVPIPSVRRVMPGFELEIKAFVPRPEERTEAPSPLCVRYELRNTDTVERGGSLLVAVRPMQVSPSYQNLNMTGGAARIRRIAFSGDRIDVDGRAVVPVPAADEFGASAFDGGEIVEHLAAGNVPEAREVEDPRELASGAMAYRFVLKPGESRVVGVLAARRKEASVGAPSGAGMEWIDRRLAEAGARWRRELGGVSIALPRGNEWITDSVRANLAYILANRVGPALQPGSRCYDRAWIRDGALMSRALLSMGQASVVRAFLDWYGPYQYDSGKIPCAVDRRGPDPVAEHDSEGEYIYAVRSYFEHTRDREFLRGHYPRVVRAVGFIELLRNEQMGGEYGMEGSEKRVFRGLMPESISHEGYSAKPMHSYWDDFWTLRGLVDAVSLAEAMDDRANVMRFGALRNSFEGTLGESLRRAMRARGIDYLPGCAELGDFDATSTTVALFPGAAVGVVDRPVLDATFERFWRNFRARRDGTASWKDYTPYETRIIGSMVLLGRRDRALELLDFYGGDERPRGWRQWPEIVRRDPREPGFVGDMPHSWVGADFINSIRLMLAYTRESDGALVLGAGLPRTWLESQDGVKVNSLATEFGRVSYRVKGEEGLVRAEVEALKQSPKGGVFWSLPEAQQVAGATLDGMQVEVGADGMVRLGTLPATLTVRYRKKAE
jgi:hypothetical protein